VLQGLSLPVIIRWLGVVDDGVIEKEEIQARVNAVRAALTRLNEFSGKSDERVLARLRAEYEDRIGELESDAKTEDYFSHTAQRPRTNVCWPRHFWQRGEPFFSFAMSNSSTTKPCAEFSATWT
jgi:hypothetical protein